MNITIKSIIREYLVRKSMYDEMIVETIHRLNNEIQNFSSKSFELSDAILPAPSEIHSGKTNNKVDASYNVLARYNYLHNKIEEENTRLINEMLDYLNYLSDLKKFYGQISFIVITLEPRKSKAVKILMNGGKVCEIASALGVSYNTARRTIEAAIDDITEAIESSLKARVLKEYGKYDCCISA